MSLKGDTMKISKLIKLLEDRLKEFGDLPVHVENNDNPDVFLHTYADEAIFISKDESV